MLHPKRFLAKTEEDEEKFFDRVNAETQLAALQAKHSRNQGNLVNKELQNRNDENENHNHNLEDDAKTAD